MSFGLSPSDFVLAAEKGYAIYRKCADAPEHYRALADAVLVLRASLDKSRVFVVNEEGRFKGDRQQQDIDALVVARIASEKTLEKVDGFLDKHNKLDDNVSKGLGFIDRAAARSKFLFSGIDGLRERVKSNAELLNQCLTVLTSVSVSLMHQKLDKIREDSRSGVRAKTVITAAVLDGKRVDVEEVIEQVQKDLIEEGVHPDAIDLQSDIIRQWAIGVVDSGELSESENEDATLWKDFAKSGFASDDTPPAAKSEGMPLSSPSIETDEELYASSVAPRETHLEPPPKRGRPRTLQPPSENTPSRASSLGSHQSQDSQWRRFPELSNEAQTYIHRMLAKALSMEPFGDLIDVDTASFYFRRGFSQQDAHDRGYLTRNEVASVGVRAAQDAGVDFSPRAIARIIDGYDDGDAKIDREEFLSIMHELRLQIHEELKHKWRRLFDQASAAAMEKATIDRLNSPDAADFLHWGFQREVSTRGQAYLDVVENKPLGKRPPQLPSWSFTVMAYEAANCVTVVDLAENEWWNRVLPDQAMRNQFHQVFTVMREVALRFALFENKTDRSQLSDLDEMVAIVRLLAQTEGIANIADHPMKELCQAKGKAYALLQSLIGFRLVLQSDHRLGVGSGLMPLGRPSTATLPNDLKRWKENHMDSWAKLISETADSEWPSIETAALRSRLWYDSRGSVSSPGDDPKAKVPMKSKAMAASGESQSLASTSHSLLPNKLAESARFVASSHCATIRTAELADLDELRASPRRCRMRNFEVNRIDYAKGRFSFRTRGKPIRVRLACTS